MCLKDQSLSRKLICYGVDGITWRSTSQRTGQDIMNIAETYNGSFGL
jgi:hypothetical protein